MLFYLQCLLYVFSEEGNYIISLFWGFCFHFCWLPTLPSFFHPTVFLGNSAVPWQHELAAVPVQRALIPNVLYSLIYPRRKKNRGPLLLVSAPLIRGQETWVRVVQRFVWGGQRGHGFMLSNSSTARRPGVLKKKKGGGSGLTVAPWDQPGIAYIKSKWKQL